MWRAGFTSTTTTTAAHLGLLALLGASWVVGGCHSRTDHAAPSATTGAGARAAAPSWARDIGPLVARRCGGCHAAAARGTVATPPALGSYEDARRAAGAALLAIRRRTMPPFAVDDTGLCGSWLGAAWLTDAEIATFAAWVEAGAPRGDDAATGGPAADAPAASNAPAPRLEDDAASARQVTVDPGVAFAPELGEGAYRCFVVEQNRALATFITGWTVSSEPPSAVRQAALYEIEDARAASTARARQHHPGVGRAAPGWPCYGAPDIAPAKLLASWSRDTPVLRLPAGTGLALGDRSVLVLQMRYDLVASAPGIPVRARMILATSDAVARTARLVPIRPAPSKLLPGEAQIQVHATWTADRAAQLWGLVPRMHSLGRVLDVERIPAGGGNRECFAHVGHWNLYDQQLFLRVTPVALAPGDQVSLTCAYATTSRDADTKMGEAPDNEQCLAHLYLVDPP